MTPEEIVASANENRVGLLAIADHNRIEGSIEAQDLCRASGIHYIPAVEIDTLDNENLFHILAYGFEVSNSVFTNFLNLSRFILDEMSVKLIERMQSDYKSLSLSDFFEYDYDMKLGGWKGLHYLLEQKVTTSLVDGIKCYFEYGVTHGKSGFSSIAAAAYRIKTAGGYSVLAHPGETIDTSDICAFKEEMRRIISCGVEGIECYYPRNTDAVTKACLEVCEEYDLLITGGSDCHGIFANDHRIGEMDLLISKLKLKELGEKSYV